MFKEMSEGSKTAADASAGALSWFALFSDTIPALAALASLFWFGTRIYEWWRVRVQGKKPDDLTKG